MSWTVLPCGKIVSTHTRIAWVELPIWLLHDQDKLFEQIEISTLSYISVYFLDALWLCYQLTMHAYSDTDLRKFDLCKFFSVFLVFQCGASGRSLLASGQVGFSHSDGSCLESRPGWSLIVRTIRVLRPDRCWLLRPDSIFISSRRARPVCSFLR
jgi:hypothetical protein